MILSKQTKTIIKMRKQLKILQLLDTGQRLQVREKISFRSLDKDLKRVLPCVHIWTTETLQVLERTKYAKN